MFTYCGELPKMLHFTMTLTMRGLHPGTVQVSLCWATFKASFNISVSSVFYQKLLEFTDSLFYVLFCGSVLQQVYTVELFFVSHPGFGGKYWEECSRGTRGGGEQLRQREGSTPQEFCWVGVSLLHFRCPPLMPTQCWIQSFSNNLLSQVPSVLPTGIKPQRKRYGGRHLKTLINGYFCIRRRQRERERLYFVK